MKRQTAVCFVRMRPAPKPVRQATLHAPYEPYVLTTTSLPYSG